MINKFGSRCWASFDWLFLLTSFLNNRSFYKRTTNQINNRFIDLSKRLKNKLDIHGINFCSQKFELFFVFPHNRKHSLCYYIIAYNLCLCTRLYKTAYWCGLLLRPHPRSRANFFSFFYEILMVTLSTLLLRRRFSRPFSSAPVP